MENVVYQRFIEAVNYLKSNKIAKSKKEIAASLGVSANYFTELLGDRINISGELLQIFLSKWPVNPSYIFGFSDEINVNTPSPNQGNVVHEPTEKYNSPIPTSQNVSPKSNKSVSPTVSPTPKMELPKVVTVDKTGNDNIVMVPVAARAGYLLGYGDIEYIKELPTYHIPRLQNGTFRAFEVDGHSMTPTITHGDIVFAEWVEKFEHITDDRVYVIITKTDGIVIKRVLNRVEQYGFLVAKSDSITNKRQYPNLNIPPSEVLELWQAKMYLGADFSSPHSLWDRINDLEAAMENLKASKGD